MLSWATVDLDKQYSCTKKTMSLNVVNLVGRVGGDPDVKYFESGSVRCNLTLAVNRRSRNNEQPDWFNLELWGKTAGAIRFSETVAA